MSRSLRTRLDISQRRLEHLAQKLSRASQRFSRWRLVFFALSLVLVLILFEINQKQLALAVFALATAGFIYLVKGHQKIRQQQRKVQLAIKLKRQHVARLELNWQDLPEYPLEEPVSGHPFELDLDITGPRSLLRLLDTCLTFEAHQRLKHWLLCLEPNPDIVLERQQQVAALKPLLAFREGLILLLAESASRFRQFVAQEPLWRSAAVLHNLEQVPQRHLGRALLSLMVLSAFNLVLYVATQFKMIPFWYWQAGLSIYIICFWIQRQQIQELFKESQALQFDLQQLYDLFLYLERKSPYLPQPLQSLLKAFLQADKPSKLIQQLSRVVSAASLQANPFVWVIFNVFVPWDFYFAWRFEQLKPQLKVVLPEYLDVIWELEALNSLAHYAYLHPQNNFPIFIPSGFYVQELGHPLLPEKDKIRNHFELIQTGKIFLITGSNMAGKSTFLKSLGLNIVLAQAGTVVDSPDLKLAWSRLFSCIKVSDSVNDGLSYFYTEVLRLKALLDQIELEPINQLMPVFFLVDEIFKGTNNRERLIGSRAYIQALSGKNALGGVSSHDLELVSLAQDHPDIENYHFRESIIEGRMVFDFKLRPGPCPTTNALEIMRLAGLPID